MKAPPVRPLIRFEFDVWLGRRLGEIVFDAGTGRLDVADIDEAGERGGPKSGNRSAAGERRAKCRTRVGKYSPRSESAKEMKLANNCVDDIAMHIGEAKITAAEA